MHDAVSVVLDTHREADIGRAVQQDRIAGRGERGERGNHATKHAVLIADGLAGQSRHAVARGLPADDRVEILVGWTEIAVCRVFGAFDDRFRDGRNGREVHVGNPHRNHVEPFLRRIRREAELSQPVDRNRIFAMTVHDGREIVSHTVPFTNIAGGETFILIRSRFTIESSRRRDRIRPERFERQGVVMGVDNV